MKVFGASVVPNIGLNLFGRISLAEFWRGKPPLHLIKTLLARPNSPLPSWIDLIAGQIAGARKLNKFFRFVLS